VANTIHVKCVEADLLWHYDLEGGAGMVKLDLEAVVPEPNPREWL
jgi:hypothetical protein